MISGKIMENEPMANHTSYGIGGPVLAFIEPKSVTDLQIINSFAEKHNVTVHCIGNGSNLLVSDDGINGFVVSLEKSFKKIIFDKNKCYAEAGVKLSKLVKECIKRNFIGLETLIGIPGTLGGALIMNAGAFGNEISNYLTSIELLNGKGIVEQKSANEIEFSYRSSTFNTDEIILSTVFQLEKATKSEIRKNRDQANLSRKRTQPLKFRSAGSVFKNPKDFSAGYLIDQAGLKGKSIGGAIVSDLHANFIINQADAKADDIVQLIKIIRDTILKKYSIALELEITTLGFPEGTFHA
ncbi:MAG: UDP-N-acetylmuramate dehydrogenase [Planctomycetia bacterium]|nr:UDP-N-acetylmuramate dehydrogenase [Planctomycetia bacterium]